jgi:histidyl-tRNA synthetase
MRTAEEKAALLRQHEEEKNDNAYPTFLYRQKRAGKHIIVSLDIIGRSGSIADALLVTVILHTLRESGVEKPFLRVNSVGDRESFMRFSREFTLFSRKHGNDLPPTCRERIYLEHQGTNRACTHDACEAFRRDAPTPLEFLNEAARAHFKEVLEYAETLSLPYILHERLAGPTNICSHTVFRIDNETGETLASGFRYNTLARRLGFRREIPAIGAEIRIAGEGAESTLNKPPAPGAYFIHLGHRARLQGLRILETLRQAHITTHHSLTNEKLSVQMSHADTLHTPYLIIVGHKEAVEGTALIRDRERSFQEILPQSALPIRLAHLLR